MIDAKHPFVPFGGETENGFRKFCAAHAGEGLKCSSAGTGPAQVAVAIKTAIAALEGKVVPQSVKLPLADRRGSRTSRTGQDYFPDQSDNFFVGNSFPTCGINFTAQEIMGQSEGEPVSRCELSTAAAAEADARCARVRMPGKRGRRDGAWTRPTPLLSHGGRVQALRRRARARERADLDVTPGASTPSSARTAPANRR